MIAVIVTHCLSYLIQVRMTHLATYRDGDELQFLNLTLSPPGKRRENNSMGFSLHGELPYMLDGLEGVEVEEAIVREGDEFDEETCNALAHGHGLPINVLALSNSFK